MGRSDRIRGAVAALAAIVLLAPLVVLVLGALNAPRELLPSGWAVVPRPPTLDALDRAFSLVAFGTQLRNSLIVVAIAVPLSLLSASLAAFAMVMLEGPRRALLVGLAVALLAVPASAVWVPRFFLFSELGLVDTFVPLIAPALLGTTPFAVLLFYWSFRRIPPELLDAARIAGLGPLRMWRLVALPRSVPTAIAAGALVFIAHWGAFVDPLLYLYSPNRYTLPLGLSQLRLLGPVDQATILAGAAFIALPTVIAYAAIQRRLARAFEEAGWLAS